MALVQSLRSRYPKQKGVDLFPTFLACSFAKCSLHHCLLYVVSFSCYLCTELRTYRVPSAAILHGNIVKQPIEPFAPQTVNPSENNARHSRPRFGRVLFE